MQMFVILPDGSGFDLALLRGWKRREQADGGDWTVYWLTPTYPASSDQTSGHERVAKCSPPVFVRCLQLAMLLGAGEPDVRAWLAEVESARLGSAMPTGDVAAGGVSGDPTTQAG